MSRLRDRRRVESVVRRAAWEGLEGLEPRQHLALVMWTGGAATNEWNDAGNWSGNAVPGASADVVIPANASAAEILVNAGIPAIASLVSHKPIRIDAWTLQVAGTSTLEVGAELRLSGGTFRGGGTTQLNGGAVWEGGTLTSAAGGSVEIPVGQSMSIVVGSNHHLSTTLKNYGTLNWTGGTIILDNAGVLRNEPGGTFTITALNGDVLDSGVGTSILNLGQMTVNVPNGSAIDVNPKFYHRTAPGAAGLSVASGDLILRGDGENNQTIDVAAGARMVLHNANSNGTFVHKNATYTGAGELVFSRGIQQINGFANFAATTTAALGTITAATGTNPRILGSLTIAGATLSNAEKLIVYGTLTFNAGTINGTGELSIFNAPGQPVARFIWNDGDITGTGLLKVYSTGKMQILTSAGRNLTRTLENRGSLVWGAGTVFLQSSGKINNFGTFDAKAPGFSINGSAGSWVRNHAALNTTIPAGQAIYFNCEVINDADAPAMATLTVTGGTPWFNTQGLMSDRILLNSGAEVVFSGNASPGFTFRDLVTGSVNTSGVPGTQGKRVRVDAGTVTLLGTSTFGVPVAGQGAATIKAGANAGGVPSRVLGTMTLEGATLNTDKPLTIAGSLFVTAFITGTDVLRIDSGSAQNPARLSWLGGSIGGAGDLIIAAGQRLEITGNLAHTLARDLFNLGTIIWNGGSIFLDDGGVLNNEVGGVFNARLNNGSINDASIGTPLAFVNRGTFSVHVTPGTSTFINVGFVFSNLGHVIVTQGTLQILSDITQLTGSFQAGYTLGGGRWTASGNAAIDLGIGFRTVVAVAQAQTGLPANPTVISLAGAALFNNLASVRSNAGRIFLGTGATLTVSVAGFTFENSGRIDVMQGATLVVALGNYRQTAAGMTVIGIASSQSHGRINVLAGTTQIAGVLLTQYVGGYSPIVNQSFIILTYTAGLVGQFVLQPASASMLAYVLGQVRLIML
ncbi:MAG: hypothetical protein JNM80_06140 [Phycisphaerae bacterium]|nr:hypothetical protein [Phycisphaerae bacterium]